MNFPENAATDTDNCIYSPIGNVTRRLGIDKEINGITIGLSRDLAGLSDYKWDNAGGDGTVQLVVRQVGSGLYFYRSSTATEAAPLTVQRLVTTVDLNPLVATGGGSIDPSFECQYADGNGFLIVLHPSCDPFYCTYNIGTATITVTRIILQIRDLVGVLEPTLPNNVRPSTLPAIHLYNLYNQGWVKGNAWSATSTSAIPFGTGSKTWTIAAGLPVTIGDVVTITANPPFTGAMSGGVTAYAGTSLTVNVTNSSGFGTPQDWSIVPTSTGLVFAWQSAVGNYPSNADQWWSFKNSSGVFDPATTAANVTISSSPAPKGHFIIDVFNQQKITVSGVDGISATSTLVRPKTGCWFQGRAWYTGADAHFNGVGNASTFSWTENIYFSQVITDPIQFGYCYQQNDPTAEDLFDLLPTDGGVIVIQGCGSIFKLFPIQNGILVFAGNGIWFITGSQGIGFRANDYTVTKISSVKSISSTSFVDVNGLPYFWNEEGIYTVQPSKGGGLEVSPITVGTILTFYSKIPVSCKKYARGAYNSVDYVIQWVYRDKEFSSVTERYAFNRVLNFNDFNNSFFPYTVDNTVCNINGILYVAYPGGSNSPEPGFKYPATVPTNGLTYADENDLDYVDWTRSLGTGIDYNSYFITGYKLRGSAIKKYQSQYLQIWSSNNGAISSYKIQGLWNFANDKTSGRWSNLQLITNALTKYDIIYRRHKIRGSGFVLQFKISSVLGMPFDIKGWAAEDTVNQGT